MERSFNTAEVVAAVKIHLAACLMENVPKELSRVLSRQQRGGVAQRAKNLNDLYNKVVSLAGDADEQAMVRNRADVLTVQVGYAKTAPGLDDPFCYAVNDYNKTWRCWLRKPTAEEMEREKWND